MLNQQKQISQPGSGGFLRPEEILRANIVIRQGSVITDLGCGSGYFTIPLARAVGNQGKVYAVDVLSSALDSVRSRAKLEGIFNIETMRANAEAYNGVPIEDGTNDMVMLSNILFQSDKKLDIIKEALRILKPGGSLVLIEWNQNNSFGPPTNQRVKIEYLKRIAVDFNLDFVKEFDAGAYHYGLMFGK